MSNRLKLVTDHAGAEFCHDPWGVAVNLAFDICEVLDAADIEGDITPTPFTDWGYQRGAAATVPSLETLAADTETSYGAAGLAQAVLDGDITTDDLIYAGSIISRYTGLLEAAGRSY